MSVLHTGSVTFVQRVDSALRLNVHAHTLSLDGVYLRQGPRSAPTSLTFLPLPEPSAQDVQELAERTAARIERLLRAHGRYLDDEQDGDDADTLGLQQPALSACYQAAASGSALPGTAHKPPVRVLSAAKSEPSASLLRAQVRGVNVHAGWGFGDPSPEAARGARARPAAAPAPVPLRSATAPAARALDRAA